MSNDKNYNSGNRNSGYRNSGDYNSGYRNSGDRNSGDWNSGDYNSGYRNSGDRNSGDWNSGYRNSGDWNSGNWNSGFFNTNEPRLRIFNKETDIKRTDISIPVIDLKLTEWIDESNMTTEQKKNDPDFSVKGGTLISRSYKEAWALYWSEASQKDKQKFLDLPHFDAGIFKEIRGIDVASLSCNNKVVIIEGKKYKLQEVVERE